MSTWKKVLLEDANISVGTITATLTDQTTDLDANNHAAVELVVVESGVLKTRTADFNTGAFGTGGSDVDVSDANLRSRLAALQPQGGTLNIGDAGDDMPVVVRGTLTVENNLIVNGTTSTINSTTLTVDDKNIVLASGATSASAADGAGIEIDVDADASYSVNPQIQWQSSHAAFSEFQMVKGGGESTAFIAAMMEEANFTALNATTPGVGTFGIVGGVLYVQTA